MTSYEKCIDMLLTRRSIRRFQGKDVSLDLLLKILDIARYAPSARNSQPWEYIIVKDKELKEKLGKIHPYAEPLLDAPAGILVVCDKNASPTSYMLDCANTVMYILLALHAHGLGGVWIQTLRNIKEIQELLGLPGDKIPVALIAVGWPAEKPEPKPRKPLEDITYIDGYGSGKKLASLHKNQ